MKKAKSFQQYCSDAIAATQKMLLEWKNFQPLQGGVSRELKIGAGVLVGMVCCAAVLFVLSANDRPKKTVFCTQPIEALRIQRVPMDVARPHLDWARQQCLDELSIPIVEIEEMFDEARSHARSFAEAALGGESKWTMMTDFVQSRKDHAAFLRRKFESIVLSEADLLSALSTGLDRYHQSVASIEGQMLVSLRSDVEDLTDCPLQESSDPAQLQSLFAQALNQSEAAAGIEMKSMIGREIASFILGEIAAQVGVQLGVSAGILGTGAGSGWATFGVGVIAGFAVDYAITSINDHINNPKGKLANQIVANLNQMERLILEGNGTAPGLRAKLQEFALQRASLREAAVLKLLEAAKGGAQ